MDNVRMPAPNEDSTPNVPNRSLNTQKSDAPMSLHYFARRASREAYGVMPESFMEMDMNTLLIQDKVASYLYLASDDNIELVQKDAVLVVDRSLKQEIGDIVVVAVNGEILLRRLVKVFHPLKQKPLHALVTDREGEQPIYLDSDFSEVRFKGVVRSIIHFCRP